MENLTEKITDFIYTKNGPIAKIDGTWYSVNGDTHDIVDVRYPLTENECKTYNVKND